MLNLIKGELFKLRHSTGFRILMSITAVIALFECISMAYGNGVRLTGYEAFYSQFYDFRTLIFVLAGAFSGIFIGEDYACRAYQAEIASGYSRFKVLASKTIVYMLGISLIISLQLIIITFGVTVLSGFGEVASAYIMLNMIRAGLMFMLHICACSMLCLFTSTLLKNKGSILAVNFLLIVIIDGLLQMGSTLSDSVLAIYLRTPFLQTLVSSAPEMSVSELLRSCIIGIVAIVCLYSLAYIAFRRCELK